MFDNLGAKPRQRLAQRTFADVVDHRFGRGDCLGGWRPSSRNGGPARHRPLPQGNPVDAGKAQVAIDAFNHNRARCCNSSAKPTFRPGSPALPARARSARVRAAAISAPKARTWPRAFRRRYPPNKGRSATREALPGKDRIDHRADEIGQRPRPGRMRRTFRHAPL